MDDPSLGSLPGCYIGAVERWGKDSAVRALSRRLNFGACSTRVKSPRSDWRETHRGRKSILVPTFPITYNAAMHVKPVCVRDFGGFVVPVFYNFASSHPH